MPGLAHQGGSADGENSRADSGDHSARRLRIAMIAPPFFELPPTGYGGVEAIVADLVDQLADRGHDVLLIGAGRHRTRAARFCPVFGRPPSERLGAPVPEVIHAARAAAALRDVDVDIVHDHTLAGPLLAPGRRVPTVVTVHSEANGELGSYYAALGDSVDMVAISDAQRSLNPHLNWVGTVHNAIDVASFPYRERKDDYVLWLGRFCDQKGAHLAIDAARAAGLPIVLAGKCSEPAERGYFEREITPRLGPSVRYVGEADAAQKRQLLSRARALAFPVQWEEPFGLVMIEAMACGTPVIALRHGAAHEIVANGETGFVCSEPGQLVPAVNRIDQIDPRCCRARVERRFPAALMVSRYESLYRAQLGQVGE